MKREATNRLRAVLDSWLPPVIRDNWPFPWLVKRWLGPHSISNFKQVGFTMSDAEFIAAYRSIEGAYSKRGSDTTVAQLDWLAHHTGTGRQLLEVGPGNGVLTKRLLQQSNRVTTLDLFPARTGTAHAVMGVVERLPFRDKSFDTVILAHVIEHTRSLTRTILELERVTRRRILIVTPSQRYYRATFDYHLHFFFSPEHLASHVTKGISHGELIDNDICLIWDLKSGTT